MKKTAILRIAKLYGIAETTLRRHIPNPGQCTSEETTQKTQALTVAEKAVLVKRLVFLDDTNIPADRETFYRLAHALLDHRDPNRELGRDWLNRFLERHLDIKYVLAKTIATNRANAQSWDIMDDFYVKVGEIFYFLFIYKQNKGITGKVINILT